MDYMRKILAALQWVVFHLGVVISVPIIVGNGFELSADGIENLMRLTFFIAGTGSLLQVFLGHRNMLVEGPAGPWWAAYLVIVSVAIPGGTPIEEVRTDIQGAVLVAGVLLFIAGIAGLIRRLQGLFTPRVTGVFLMLIGVQVSGIAVNRMVSHGLTLFLISLGVLVLSMLMLTHGRGILKEAALLLSVLVGWSLSALLGLLPEMSFSSSTLVTMPNPLPWGSPTFDLSTTLTLSILAVLLIPNQIGGLKAMESAMGKSIPVKNYDRGLAATGLTTVFAGLFGGSGTTPFAISAGLVSITGERKRDAFILGAVIFVLLATVGPLGALLSTIPPAIAGAILLTSVASLVVIGMRSVTSEPLEGMRTFTVGLGLLTGTGLMFVPTEFWTAMPAWVAGIFSNGAITGTLSVLALEHLILRTR